MFIKSCLYGKDTKYHDVTDVVLQHLNLNTSDNSTIKVCNTTFGVDPCFGIRKELVVTMDDNSIVVVREGGIYPPSTTNNNNNSNINNNVYYSSDDMLNIIGMANLKLGNKKYNLPTLLPSLQLPTISQLPTTLHRQDKQHEKQQEKKQEHSKGNFVQKQDVSCKDKQQEDKQEDKQDYNSKEQVEIQEHRSSLLLSPSTVVIFYHIFTNSGKLVFEIFEEQVNTIMCSPLFNEIQNVNCCVTGNDMTNYHKMLERISQLSNQTNGKFRVYKTVFGDGTIEKFTYYAIKDYVNNISNNATCSTHDNIINNNNNNNTISSDNVNCSNNCNVNNTFIIYMHTKGTSGNSISIRDWRHCMEYFILTKIDYTINRMIAEDAESAGALCQRLTKAKTPLIYAGNFWCARASLLKRLFDKVPLGRTGLNVTYKRYDFSSDYYVCEYYLFKEKHKFVDLYPKPDNYHGYLGRLPMENYMLK